MAYQQENKRTEIDTTIAYQAVESANIGLWQLDLATQEVIMSDTLYDILGLGYGISCYTSK